MTGQHRTSACLEDDALLSGYLDEVLSQGDEQRVRVHLEDCARCRAALEEMRAIREAARTTPFRTLSDDQWNEQPRSGLSRWSRNLGWVMLVVWTVAIVALTVVLPQFGGGRWLWIERALIWVSFGGFGALVISVTIDRFRLVRRDKYRGVKR